MSRHIAPHRWADASAGRLGDAELAAMTVHATSCRACARARDRVTTATGAFAAIRARPTPEVKWDHVRARVHWSVSSERRAQDRERARVERARWQRVAAPWGIAIAATTVLAAATGPLHTAATPAAGVARAVAPATTHASPAPIAVAVAATAVAPGGLHGLVSRAAGDVSVDGAHADDLFDRQLATGTVLTTGDGRVDVQFGDASAFALGPHSRLELRRFDVASIELVVDGTVDVQVAPRAATQRFTVLAGARTIEVRGTQFRVTHDAGDTAVACRHGLVAVRDRQGELEVSAARHLAIHGDHAVTAETVGVMSGDELTVLAQATPLTLPLWDDAGLARSSAPLEVVTPGRRAVRVDGVELGDAPLRVRVMPGRHLVESADLAGRYRRAGWAEVAAPTGTDHGARLIVPADVAPSADVGARRRQLLAGIDRARLAHCVRSIAKAGLTGTYVQIELAVDANGAVGFLNVLDTDLPSATASCVREVLADVRFGAGAAASWRERVEL